MSEKLRNLSLPVGIFSLNLLLMTGLVVPKTTQTSVKRA